MRGVDGSFEQKAHRRVASFFGGLLKLVGTGKVFDMSMGLVVAGCFSSLVKSLADNLVAPTVSFFLPIEGMLKNMFIVLQCGPPATICSYDSVEMGQLFLSFVSYQF
uniref:Uncharacterized protein n=1 Tax=Spongospora subterranea TaxID=70186 RepID=A0A0H5QHJ5_9EUKA|eukprot:CRZ01453.1 hypothetical protein [Spongospora subterranea]